MSLASFVEKVFKMKCGYCDVELPADTKCRTSDCLFRGTKQSKLEATK